jgi:hypothetical protein
VYSDSVPKEARTRLDDALAPCAQAIIGATTGLKSRMWAGGGDVFDVLRLPLPLGVATLS